jgi:hypothetical protein
VRILVGDVERVAVFGARVGGVRRARLDRIGHEPVVDELELGDMRRLGERRIGRRFVAERPDVAGIVGRGLMNRARRSGFRGIGDGGKNLVVDFDQLGRVARLRGALGDHHGNPLADVAHLALCERREGRLLHRLAVHIGDQPAAGQAADFRRRKVGAGVDGEDPVGRARFLGGNLSDGGVRVRRAQERGVRLARQRDVVGELPGAGEEAVVFLALDARADQRGVHSLPPMAFAPAMMLFTML